MSNVINLFEDDLKSCSYFDCDKDIGLSMRDLSMALMPIDRDMYEITLGNERRVYDRKELAEFLKVAAILVDSEDRWLPNFDLIGHNYE